MDPKEGMNSGVTVIAAEAPSSYHIAPRTESSPQVGVTQPVVPSQGSPGLGGTLVKKKRGRPRKYGPDGTPGRALSPMPISSSAPAVVSPVSPPATGEFSSGKQGAPPSTAVFSTDKRGRGRPVGSDSKPRHKGAGSENLGDGVACTSGGSFTPHMINVNTGEDVTMKIISFSQQGPRAICIMSASGAISNVTLRQSDSSGGTVTYEGRFEILTLSGSFTPTDAGGSRVSRAGGMSISMSSPDGRVIGGMLAGLLIAASPVQVVVGSFLPSNHIEPKPKKYKPRTTSSATDSATTHRASNGEQNDFNLQNQNNSAAENSKYDTSYSNTAHGYADMGPSSTPQTDNWANLHIVQDERRHSTDINIPLQRE